VRIRDFLFAPFVVLFAIAAALAADEPVPAAGLSLDLAIPESVLDLGSALAPREAGGVAGWFTLAVRNSTALPVTRILLAADVPSSGISFSPPTMRPALVEAMSSDSAIAVEPADALGANAFRVTVPASGAVTLALRFRGVEDRPVLLAWMEPALIRHGLQTTVLSSVATGLLAAGFALALGAAFLMGTIFARWAAVFLAAILFAQLTATSVFDNSFLAALSGPHGLFAFVVAAALASGLCLLDRIAPLDLILPGFAQWRNYAALGILAVGALAYAGVPFLGSFVRVLTVAGATAAAAYLVHCGRAGNVAARRLAPAATIFGLVTAAASCNALGLFGVNLVASRAIGGFAAAGSLLIAIATAIPFEPAPEILLDSDARKNEEEEQHEIAALTASHQGVFDLDLHTGLVSLSTEAARLLDLPPGAVEISHDNWLSRLHPDDRNMFREALDTYRDDPGVAFHIEFRARGQGGSMAWFELRATMTGQATEAERCLGLIANVTARKSSDTLPSTSDPLTGLGSRAALISWLDAEDTELKGAALAVFDLDRFKSVNDSLGRDGGDALLVAFSERLTRGFAGDEGVGTTLFRVGGDMFAATVKNVTELRGFGERLVDMLRQPFTIDGRDIYLPSSVGIATGEHAKDGQSLFNQAEIAMVQAKREGGGRAIVYTRALARGGALDSVALETGLRQALERKEIEVHYQPIMRLKDGTIAGFEALARWRHPERGLIEPETFVPHAERSGLIVPLGKFVLGRAAEDLARWQKLFPAKPPLFVSVNVAWRQIRDKSFAKELSSLLRNSGLVKQSLKLEVTEGQLMAGSGHAEVALKRLKALGVGLSIDDFGTGHSSLGRLGSLPFDTVKIDKSFLAASTAPNGVKILAAMVSLARALNMSAVCEGVENAEEAARLKEMGCEYGQGYLLGSPIPASEIHTLIGKAKKR